MKNESTIKNDIFIMNQAVLVLDHHFTFVSLNEESSVYGHKRLTYLKDGIKRYEESSGEDDSVTQSLLNLFSSLYNEKSKSLDGVVWSDIRDELSRIVINV